ncbi:MAG: hypothetical protein QOC64_550, partial [Solirubrobacteraceae bacterium]|nr:hypothetical protein [Solirubrobacteraceae bacterium]
DGGWAIDRFSWSPQWREDGVPPRFRARTLFSEPRRGEPSELARLASRLQKGLPEAPEVTACVYRLERPLGR